jgi:hypothetical protein
MVGMIERRLLVNYRVEAEALAHVVPPPFRPQLVGGVGVAGICMIRLGHLRPFRMPRGIGVTTENAAHRVAVEWDGPDGVCRGVYIPRRDTASRVTVLLGGRVFPGEHHRAQFQVREREGRYEVAFTSADGSTHVGVIAQLAAGLPAGSVFASLEEASAFFESAPLGYSATRLPDCFEGLELTCSTWSVAPLLIERAESSFFEDRSLFPAGAVEFDSALVMRDIPVTWRAREQLRRTGSRDRARSRCERVMESDPEPRCA